MTSPTPKPRVYLGADHAGFKVKESVKEALAQAGFGVEDLGAPALDPADDYPAYGHAVAERVAADPNAVGILSCGNAQGICIVANKTTGVRAATGFNVEEAKTSRTDDNANILCLPGRFVSLDEAVAIAKAWLDTPFSGAARHVRRLEEVNKIEEDSV